MLLSDFPTLNYNGDVHALGTLYYEQQSKFHSDLH